MRQRNKDKAELLRQVMVTLGKAQEMIQSVDIADVEQLTNLSVAAQDLQITRTNIGEMRSRLFKMPEAD